MEKKLIPKTVRVEPSLWAIFQVHAQVAGDSVQGALIRAMTLYIESQEQVMDMKLEQINRKFEQWKRDQGEA